MFQLKIFILLTIYLTIIVIYSRCILNQLENKYIVILNKFTISIISGNLKPKLKKKNNIPSQHFQHLSIHGVYAIIYQFLQ